MSSTLTSNQDILIPQGVSREHVEFLCDKPLRMLGMLLGIPWYKAIAIIFIFILKHSPVLVFPVFIEKVLEVLGSGQASFWKELWWPTIGIFILQLSNVPSHTLFIELISLHIRRFEKNLRSLLIRRLQYLSMSFHNSKQTGELQAKVLRDVEQVEFLVRHLCIQIPIVFLGLAFAIGMTILREPKMLIFYLLAVPVAMFLTTAFREMLKDKNRDFRLQVEQMSSTVGEMISMIPISKAHGLERNEIERVECNLNAIERKGRALDRGNAFFDSSTFITIQITQLSCLVATGMMCSHGWIGIPELVLYQTLFGFLVNSSSQLIGLMPQLSKGMESLRSLGEVLKLNNVETGFGKKELDLVTGRIDFENVSFRYEDKWAVRNLSFTAWPGDCIAFVGESGSGKSTIMNLIIGFYKAQEGNIKIDQVDQTNLNLPSWRRHVAVVPQSVMLFSGSLRENICYGVGHVSDEKLQEIISAAQLRSVVEMLPQGLDTLIGENGVKCSGGQRQRIAIARALIRDPKIIILDEATSALDVISEREVQLAIDTLVKGRTTFIVAHRLSTIRQANRVMVMKRGCLVESGSQEELMAMNGEFARLKNLQ